MTRLKIEQNAKLNLSHVTILIVVSNKPELEMLSETLAGFGARQCSKCATAAEAKQATQETEFDLAFVDSALTDEDGFEFIRWFRSSGGPSRYAPLMLVTGHTQRGNMFKARDCGANFVLAKPISSPVLFKRISWLAREQRPFVETSGYVGPDRRFRKIGPPAGERGRRSDDLPPEVGEAVLPNLSQGDIDALFVPQRL